MKNILAALLMGVLLPASALTIDTSRGNVEVEENPEKTVVIDVDNLDTLFSLGIQPAGIPENIYVKYLPDQGLDRVGGLFTPDIEAINAIEPNLIILGSASASSYDALKDIAPTIDMSIDTGDLWHDTLKKLDTFATLYGKEDEAAAIKARLEDKMHKAQAAVEDKGNATILLITGRVINTYSSGGRLSWLHDVVGIPPADTLNSADSHGQPVSFEYLAETNPDWLIVVDRGHAIGSDPEGNAKTVLDNELVRQTTASKKNQIVYLPPDKAYISTGGVQALEGILDSIIAAFSKPSP